MSQAAKATNYTLDQTAQTARSPSTTRSSLAHARTSAGGRPRWQRCSTRLAAYGRRGALDAKVGGAFVVGDQGGGWATTLFTIITKLLHFIMTVVFRRCESRREDELAGAQYQGRSKAETAGETPRLNDATRARNCTGRVDLKIGRGGC
jgi:multimeric flavodoxin WrbA